MADMSDEPQEKSGTQGKALVSGASAVGGLVGFVVFKYLEFAHDYHLAAGEESIAGTGFGTMLVWIWWLFEPRVKRWRNRR
jgi:hypothetical protein